MKLVTKIVLLGSLMIALTIGSFFNDPVWPAPPVKAETVVTLDDDPVWP
jgi:hypothetical protein